MSPKRGYDASFRDVVGTRVCPGGETVDACGGVVFVVRAGSSKWVFIPLERVVYGLFVTSYICRASYAAATIIPSSEYVNETALAKNRFKTGGMAPSGTLAWRSQVARFSRLNSVEKRSSGEKLGCRPMEFEGDSKVPNRLRPSLTTTPANAARV